MGKRKWIGPLLKGTLTPKGRGGVNIIVSRHIYYKSEPMSRTMTNGVIKRIKPEWLRPGMGFSEPVFDNTAQNPSSSTTVDSGASGGHCEKPKRPLLNFSHLLAKDLVAVELFYKGTGDIPLGFYINSPIEGQEE